MSEYIPTTKEVRDVYAYAETYSAFDDWLEQHDTEVAKDTEQRIIKLLDDKCERPLDPEWEHHWEDGCRCALVALIKGESQKDNETVVLLTEGENK